MPKYYAWSNFPRDPIDGKAQKPISVGAEVSQADLGVDDEDWAAIIAAGSVREQPYPQKLADGKYGDSPNRYFKDLMVKAADAEMAGPGLEVDEFKELQAAGLTGDEETTTSGDAAEEVVEEKPLINQ